MLQGEVLIYGPETRDQALDRVGLNAGRVAVGEEAELHVTTIEARDYQIEAWSAIDHARNAGDTAALVHLATGLGKTTLAVIDALRFIHKQRSAGNPTPRVLFACHQTEILEQAADRFAQFAPALTQGKYYDGTFDIGQDVTFATLQSLYQNLDEIDPATFDYKIYDEAHHTQAETFRSVVEHFVTPYSLALTATPERADEQRIEDLFGEPVYSKPLAEAITEDYLAHVEYHIIFDEAVKRAIESDFDPQTLKDIRELLQNESRNEEIAKQIKDEMKKIGLEDAKTLVFCTSIEQADEMASLLGGKSYHTNVSKDERRQSMHGFRNNGLQIITSRDMFNEGVDIPDARLIVFLRSTSSRTVFEQQLGRGLRKAPGKDTVTVLDFVANIERLALVKGLADKVVTARARHNAGSTSDTSHGLQITAGADSFDFDRISVSLLDKLNTLKREDLRIFDGVDNDQLIDLALSLKPEGVLTMPEIRELSKSREFISSGTLHNRFGGHRNFQLICREKLEQQGIEVSIKPIWAEVSDEDLKDLALQLKPTGPLTFTEMRERSKLGEFPTAKVLVDRFGSQAAFAKYCGWEIHDRKNAVRLDETELTNDDVINLAKTLKKEGALSFLEISKLSKSGDFISTSSITKRFGSMGAFRKACGVVAEVERTDWSKLDNDELVEHIKSAADTDHISIPVLNGLSKQGLAPSGGTIRKRFGSQKAFLEAVGYDDPRQKLREMSNEELIVLAIKLKPDGPLTQREIEQLAKDQKFLDHRTIAKRFGGKFADFQKACGF